MSSHNRYSIVSLVILLTLALAACGQSAPATQAPPAAQATQPPAALAAQATAAPAAQASSQGGKLEVFSWWTSGGEAAALEALFKTYATRDPGVEVINAAVAGGGGSAARGVLQTRLAGSDPPDTCKSTPASSSWASMSSPAMSIRSLTSTPARAGIRSCQRA